MLQWPRTAVARRWPCQHLREETDSFRSTENCSLLVFTLTSPRLRMLSAAEDALALALSDVVAGREGARRLRTGLNLRVSTSFSR